MTYPSDREVRIECGAGPGGWLVLHDSWDPGWRAWIDGQRTSIYPANLISRAVWVPEGEATLVMRYRPRGFPAGCALSLIAVSALVIGALAERRRPLTVPAQARQ